MDISKSAAGILAAVCLTAGAGGAYLATRSGAAPESASTGASAATTSAPANASVEASEAVVNDPTGSAPAGAVSQPAAAPVPQSVEPKPSTRRRDAQTARQAENRPRHDEAPASADSPMHESRTAMAPALEPARVVDPEPPKPAAPPAPQFEELVVTPESVIGLQVDTPVTSERAQVEDEVVARVTRDVKVGDRVAIPAGSRAQGEVTLVERGGKMHEKARLGVRFTSIVLADGTRVPIETDTIIREGDSPTGESAAKIGGGAIGGAIIGGILGGAKGAAIGSAVGGGAGTAAVMAGGRNPATLPSGAPVTVRLLKPATVTVEKENNF
jgi:hypothetical protein